MGGASAVVDLLNTVLVLGGSPPEECVTAAEWEACGAAAAVTEGQAVEAGLEALAGSRGGGKVMERALAAVRDMRAKTVPAAGVVGEARGRPEEGVPAVQAADEERATDASVSSVGTQGDGGVSIELLESLFRSLSVVDTYVALVKDGVPNAEDTAVTCAAGVRFLDYSRACEHGLALVQSRLIKLTNRVSKLVQRQTPSEADARELERWGRCVPPELASVLLRWMVHATRTAGLLSKLVGLLVARHDPRATEHEMQSADPVGLAVSTVRTPSTLSAFCWVQTQSWLGRPGWRRQYAVLWQQLLYIFRSDAPDASCAQCFLLRGCQLHRLDTHLGRRNVLSLSKFLPPFTAQPPACLCFEGDSGVWLRAITQASTSPPTRDVELLMTAVIRQSKFEVTLESVIEDRP